MDNSRNSTIGSE